MTRTSFHPIGVLLVLATLCCGCHRGAGPAIERLLLDQQEAWNRGDVDAFMQGYAQTDSLRFASSGGEIRGWTATLEYYRRAYPDKDAMGILTFDIRDIRLLSGRSAVVFGAYHLQRKEDRPTGLFTLVLERGAEGWRIVHDHTSADAP